MVKIMNLKWSQTLLKNVITADESWLNGYDRKRKLSHSNGGGHQGLQGQRMRGKYEQGQGHVAVVFIIRVWFIISTLLMVKLSTISTTSKFSIVYEMQCVARDRNCGSEMNGSSTTMMLPPIRRISFKTFWPSTESHKCGRPLLSRHDSLRLLAAPQTEDAIKGLEI